MNYEDQLVGTSQAGSNISVLDSFGFGLAIDSAACSPSAIEGVCRNVTTLETGLYPSLADVSKTSNPASPDMFVAFSSTNKTLTKKTTDRGRSWENVSAVNNNNNVILVNFESELQSCFCQDVRKLLENFCSVAH